jgi:ribonucleoside-diphosphate reductase alpha chain
VDSAVSKTCNVPQNIEWNAFKQIYIKAWEAGCKGCTTYRKGGLREGILKEAEPKEAVLEPLTCEIDPSTGRKNCE